MTKAETLSDRRSRRTSILDTLLGGRTPREFLDEYWQKKPLLIRGALPDFESPISPEELAGLALEEEAEARLILEKGGEYPWQLKHGPFEEEEFLSLPETHWTLLVQEVDQWVPDVALLLDHFRFIPKWRLDDVMVSFAPDGGNVGAHIDNYDVFLLQAAGRREWRIQSTAVHDEQLVSDMDVSMLADFDSDETWILEPGDMLYLPPRVPHHGVAVGDCMTFSIGFRAPSHEDILSAVLSRAIEELDPDLRYGDPDLQPQQHPGRIEADALARVRRVIEERLSEEHILRSFGALVTESGRSEYVMPPEREWRLDELVDAIEQGARLERVQPNRFAFAETNDGRMLLFVHGESMEIDRAARAVAPLVAGDENLDHAALANHLENEAAAGLITALVNSGHLVVERAA